MRYTKAALLIFGLGLAIGFVVVAGEFTQWEYQASLVMRPGWHDRLSVFSSMDAASRRCAGWYGVFPMEATG